MEKSIKYEATKSHEEIKKGRIYKYYNARICQGIQAGTNYTTGTFSNTMAVYIDQNSSIFINNPENYYMSIVRFVCNTSALPIRLFKTTIISPTQLSSPYSITLGYNGNYAQSFLIWEPEDLTAPVPPFENSFEFFTAPYFYLYTYTHLVKLINNTFLSAYNQLATYGALPTTMIPYMIYHRDTKTFDLITDSHYITTTVPPVEIEIYYNTPFYNLFFNSYALKVGVDDEPTGRVWQLQINIRGDNVYDQTGSNLPIYYNPYLNDISVIPIDGVIIITNQEYQTVSNLNDSQQIVFTSNKLNCDFENASPTVGWLDEDDSAIQTLSLPIITDIDMSNAIESVGSARQIVTYNPTAEYRLLNLTTTEPLKRIDLKIWWVNRYGNLLPLYLGYFNIATIKIAFISKNII